jgi:hypothetical protein
MSREGAATLDLPEPCWAVCANTIEVIDNTIEAVSAAMNDERMELSSRNKLRLNSKETG